MTTHQTTPPQEQQHEVDGEQREGRSDQQRAALARLALIVVGGLVASLLTGVTKTVLVVLALILMIMLHELGHFVMAKLAGMKVTEYFLGSAPGCGRFAGARRSTASRPSRWGATSRSWG